MNLDDTLKNETLMLTFENVRLSTLFSFSGNSQCCLTLASCKRKLLAKYCTDCLYCKYRWRHNNDVIVM